MFTYRKAAPEDAGALARLRGDFLLESGYTTQEERGHIVELSRAYLEKALADGSFVAWLAIEEGKIAATSGLTFSIVPPNSHCPDGRVAYIMNMYTLPAYRRQGVAMEVFRRIVDEARAQGYHKVTLNATDMGRPLYEKFGFKPVEGDMELYVE